jgi:hypothetical protein
LNRDGVFCSVGLVADLMRELGCNAVQPRAYRRTTIRGEHPVDAPDLLGRAFTHPRTGGKLNSVAAHHPACQPCSAFAESSESGTLGWSGRARVGSEGSVWGYVAEHLLDDADDVRVVDAIELAAAVPSRAHNACGSQFGELLARGRDCGAGGRGEGGDVEFLVREQPGEVETAWHGEQVEGECRGFKLSRRDGRGLARHDASTLPLNIHLRKRLNERMLQHGDLRCPLWRLVGGGERDGCGLS